MSPTDTMKFAKIAVTKARAALGVAWPMFGEEILRAMVAAEVLAIAGGWDRADVIPASAVTAIAETAWAMIRPPKKDPIVEAMYTATPSEARAALEALSGWVEDCQAEDAGDYTMVAAGETLVAKLNAARASTAAG